MTRKVWNFLPRALFSLDISQAVSYYIDVMREKRDGY